MAKEEGEEEGEKRMLAYTLYTSERTERARAQIWENMNAVTHDRTMGKTSLSEIHSKPAGWTPPSSTAATVH